MAKPRSLALQYLVYLAVRFLICLAQAVPVKYVLSLASPLAWVVYHLNRRHRLVATENIRHAFPDLSDTELCSMVRACYRHFVEVMIEVALMPRMIREGTVAGHFAFADEAAAATFEKAIHGGRPTIVLTCHLGNWEVMNYSLALMGFFAHTVARPLDNPFLDRFIREMRCMTGQKIIDKNGAYPQMRRVLKGGGCVAMVGDQDAGEKGLFVDFMGRPASTFKPTAHLSLSQDALLVVVATVRTGLMRFSMLVADLIDPRDYADHPDGVLAITRRYSRAMEAMVRQAPEQYFWLHRRWKHQPPEQRSAA